MLDRDASENDNLQPFEERPRGDDMPALQGSRCYPNRLLLRVPEAAQALGISRSKAYELVASGDLPSVSLGHAKRIPIAELELWIQAQLEQSAD